MNKTKILLISTGILIALAIVTGISYAIWLLTAEQTDDNLLSTECFDITFTEDANSNINLQSTYPILDSKGMTLTPYTFSVTNTCELNAKYQINLEVLNTTTLSHDLIKTMIDTDTPSIINTNNIVTSTIANSTSYTIKTDYLAYNETNNHEFRMWIDESATLDNSQNKLVEAQIVISAEPIEEIPLPPNPDNLEAPVLDSKMVAVNIAEDGTLTVADENTEYYAYNYSQWANAVIVDPTFTTLDPGATIPMESIEQMYVWIPRYEYKKSSIVNAQESIEINFVGVKTTSTTQQVNNDDVIVHPAFCWGNYCQTNRSHEENVEIPGLWVGKFELSWEDDFVDLLDIDGGYNNDNINTLYLIKPNENSIHDTNINTIVNNIKNTITTFSLDASTDVHMMKNTEWGAVAYLSQSQYGICEDDVTCSVKIENNNYFSSSNGYDIVTGCGGNDTAQNVSVSGINICPTSNRWETTNGVKASTTHNVTGIYDMAGGRDEYVMGMHRIDDSGFTTLPDAKYYDLYEYREYNERNRGLYGDATIELNIGKDFTAIDGNMESWNFDSGYFIHSYWGWIVRGGEPYIGSSGSAGIWNFGTYNGSGNQYRPISARSVISISQ